jgi:hypothetical protein
MDTLIILGIIFGVLWGFAFIFWLLKKAPDGLKLLLTAGLIIFLGIHFYEVMAIPVIIFLFIGLPLILVWKFFTAVARTMDNVGGKH